MRHLGWSWSWSCLAALALSACPQSRLPIDPPPSPDPQPSGEDASPDEAPTARPDPIEPAPEGSRARPFPITGPSFRAEGDTRLHTERTLHALDCLPGANLAGPEVYYRLEVGAATLLRADIDRVHGERVNLDLALVSEDGQTCFAGHDHALRAVIEPGAYLLVVDTWFHEGAQQELSGDYLLEVSMSLPPGPCAMEDRDQLMLWRECSTSLDCHYEIASSLSMPYLKMPAEGPVVFEAHLVTEEETFKGGWPSSIRDGLKNHYEVTEAASGYKMRRRNVWAPAGEGLNVSRFGEGSAAGYVPAAHEPWYVNMFWAFEPPKGARMILINPRNGRALVAAGGYEKGPGSSTAIGGASEEIHHHLRTSHRSHLIMGFATDQTLPLGPIDCNLQPEKGD